MWLKDDVPERRWGLSGGLAPLLAYAHMYTLRRMPTPVYHETPCA